MARKALIIAKGFSTYHVLCNRDYGLKGGQPVVCACVSENNKTGRRAGAVLSEATGTCLSSTEWVPILLSLSMLGFHIWVG